MGGRVRVIGAAVVAAVVATLVATVGGPVEPAATRQPADDRFPLEVGRPDLDHAGAGDLTVAVGAEEGALPAGRPSVRIDGTRGVSGLVRVLDADGHVAGMSLVPKDEVALLGLADEGALDVPIDYRTTAFALFASQPGLVSTEPTVTSVLAALAHDLPELDALAGQLEAAAAEDPAYLEELPDPVVTALDELVGAFQARAERLDAELSDAIEGAGAGGGDGGSGGSTSSTRDLRGRRPAQGPTDPDGCEPPTAPGAIVLDTANQDHVCLTEVSFAGGSWEVTGVSTTPRWAVARPVNHGVPAEQVQWVPGKALALPSLQGLAVDLATAAAQGVFDEVANVGIDICNGIAGLFGVTCAEPLPGLVERFVDQFESYFEDAALDFQLDGSEDQTVMAVHGIGFGEGGQAPGGDVGMSLTLTVVMDVIVPAIGILVDVEGGDLARASSPLRVALLDFAGVMASDIDAFLDAVQTGGLDDRLLAILELTRSVIRGSIETNLLEILLREVFTSASHDWVVSLLEKLSTEVATSPLKWIDVGLGAVNMGANLTLLADDLFEVSTSARYAFGYDQPPESGTEPPPAPGSGPGRPGGPGGDQAGNPALPDDACGLRVALVLDRSSSISTAGQEAMEQVRGAATGLVDALGATPSSVRISAFDTWPSTQIGWTSLADAEGRRTARQAAEGIQFDGDTNWEAALLDVFGQKADIVVFVTDGNPTTYGNGLASTASAAGSTDFDPAALAAGVEAANLLKADGTRVVAVGVGDLNVDGLRQVSGPDEGSDHFIGDLASLGRSLATVAGALCGTSVVVRHLVDGIPTAGAEYSVETPGADPTTLVTAADGTARLAREEVGQDRVTVRGPVGLPLQDVRCERGGQPIDAEVDDRERSVAVGVGEGAVTCTFEWRALQGDDAALGEIARGPGEVRVVSFAPTPGEGDRSAAGPVRGCIGVGDLAGSCASGAFGVSFTAGYAVMRYDAACDGCPGPEVLQVERVDGGVRFRLAAGGPFSTTSGSVHLDLRVGPGDARSLPALDGTVYDHNDLRVDLVRRGQPGDQCLARHEATAVGLVLPETRTIGTGTGC